MSGTTSLLMIDDKLDEIKNGGKNVIAKIEEVNTSVEDLFPSSIVSFAKEQQTYYEEAREAFKATLVSFRRIKNQYICEWDDFRYIENRLEKIKMKFIDTICMEVNKQLSINIDIYEFPKRFIERTSINYEDILLEILEDCDGLNFEERREREIRKAFQDCIWIDKIKIDKKKVSLPNYLLFTDRWGEIELSYNYQKSIFALIEALEHFEGLKENAFWQLVDCYIKRNNSTIQFKKIQFLNVTKIESFKTFKNGKVELVFRTTEMAKEFVKKYIENNTSNNYYKV